MILAVAIDPLPCGRPITAARFTRGGVSLSLNHVTPYTKRVPLGNVCSQCGVTYYMSTGLSTCGLCTDWSQPHPERP